MGSSVLKRMEYRLIEFPLPPPRIGPLPRARSLYLIWKMKSLAARHGRRLIKQEILNQWEQCPAVVCSLLQPARWLELQ